MYYLDRQIDLGDWIKKTRKEQKMSRVKLHEASGISVNMLFHMEHHISKSPTIAAFEEVLKPLGYELVIQKKRATGGVKRNEK